MTDHVRLAVVTVGATMVGIDVAAVAQALPMPEALSPLPRRAGALAGMLDVDGAPLPVVDLARWVETGASPADVQRRVVVLRHGDRRIGMLADAVQGFADVPADAIVRLHHDDCPDEVFQCAVRMPDTGAMLCVLEVGRLMALANAWHGGVASGVSAIVADARDERVQCAVLKAGDVLLALPAVRLAAVEAHPPLSRVGAGATAFCTWRERHLPVIDALAAIGDGATAAARPLLAVVDHDGCLLGIGIDGALDMRMLVPPGADTSGGIVYDRAGEALVFVDVAALFVRYPETALSTRRDDVRATQGRRAANTSALLVFDAGTTLATPAGIVEHVLPLDGEAPATMRWQDKAIRVADRRRERTGGHVMIVRDGDALVACVVERIRSMVPPGGGEVYALGKTTFVNVEGEGSYRIVDAQELTA